jgi:hypothetical protein
MLNMKKFLSLFAIVAVALVFVSIGCNPDDDPVIDLPADVVLLQEDPNDGSLYFFEDILDLDDTTTVVELGIQAVKGTGALKSLTITEDGVAVSTDRLQITDLRTGDPVTANNPLLITGDNVDGFDYEIAINVHDFYGTAAYSFDVADENNLVGSAGINITTIEPATPLDMELEGILFNAAGPAGTGGLSLNDGVGTGSASADAEIRDLGIDCAEPNNANWLAQFGTVNGADMRQVDPTTIENFAFADVDNKEIILDAYTKGIVLNDGSTVNTVGCDAVPLSVTDVAAPVAGDVYVVEAGGVYYMFEVAEVNITNDDNDDNYVLNIKY